MDKVHFILNELVMGGMVLETNMNEILTRIEEQNKIEREEVRALQTRILRVQILYPVQSSSHFPQFCIN